MSAGNYSRMDRLLVTYLLPVSYVGAGLTWSGLPLLLAEETQKTESMFVLLLVSTLAGAFFTLIGGHFADRSSRKALVLVSLAFDTLMTLLLALVGGPDALLLFYVVGFVNALAGALCASAMSVWIKDIISSDSTMPLSRSLARRGLVGIAAKGLGFALGPIIYLSMGFHALYLDASVSLAALLLMTAVHDRPRKDNRSYVGGPLASYKEIANRGFWTRERQLVLQLFLVTAAYTVPTVVIAYAVFVDSFGASALGASAFWLFASLGSIASHFGMSQRLADRFTSAVRLQVSLVVMAIGYGLMFLGSAPAVFIFGFMVFTLTNPVLSNALETEVYGRCEEAFRGRFNSVCALADDLVGAVVLLVCQGLVSIKMGAVYFVASLPLILVTFLIVRWNRRSLEAGPQASAVVGHD
jgi:MFS family permease